VVEAVTCSISSAGVPSPSTSLPLQRPRNTAASPRVAPTPEASLMEARSQRVADSEVTYPDRLSEEGIGKAPHDVSTRRA
jgi:hypothetical protein